MWCRFVVPIEIETRWGDTLIDIAHIHAGADFALADVELVRDGQLVAAPSGRIGLVDYVATPIRLPARSVPFAPIGDGRCLPYLAAALLAHLGIWSVATLTSETPEQRTAVAVPQRPVRIARAFAEPAKPAAPPDDRARDRVADTTSQGKARAAKGPAGAAAMPAARKRGHIAIQNTGEEAQLAKTEAIAQARRAGILGSTQVLLESYVSLGGAERLTSAFDNMTVTAPHAADEPGAAGGAFGVGRTGNGSGGGTTYGTIGVGDAGAFSNGTTHGHGWGGSIAPARPQWSSWQGGPYVSYRPHRRGRYVQYVTLCPPGAASTCSVEGALDLAIVRRWVKRNIQKLAYCYEKELIARSSELAAGGLVEVTFTTNADGRVERVNGTGFDDTVTACAVGVFEAIQFPRGATMVEYVLQYEVPAKTESLL